MAEAPWMNKWRRSPRQDRRVVENGKFVELGQVHPHPEEVPEQEQSALELVTVAPNVPEREQISGTEAEEGRYVETGTDGNGSTEAIDDGGASESGVQGTAEPVEGNAGADGQAPEAEGTSATEAGESDGRIPTSDSVAPESGQSLSEKMQAELEPLDAVAEYIKGSITVVGIADAMGAGSPEASAFPDAAEETVATNDQNGLPEGEDIPF